MAATAEQQIAQNPLVEGLERLPVHPTSLVIFGGTGDLAHRKLLPALYNLAHEGALPERFEMIGIAAAARCPTRSFRAGRASRSSGISRMKPDPAVLDGLLANMRYVAGSFAEKRVYEAVGRALDEFDEQAGQRLDRVFYLSTAPQFFPVITGGSESRG